jgi:opacity protein-like surface antigen
MRKLITAGLAAAMLAGVAGAAAAQPVVVERYGHWDQTWGAPPPPPMRHWRGHRTEWYGHVHGCQTRYTTYDPHRDMYRVHNRWVACR